MADTDDIEAIKRRKLEQLKQSVGTREPAADAATGPDHASSNRPIRISGPDHLRALVDEHGVVLVDFHADWCGPCQMLAPIVDQLADETAATVAKVDVDAQPTLAGDYGVQGIPTVVLFADGAPVERVVGVRGKDHYEQLIERYVA